MRQPIYANLVLSGGGIRGIAYSGIFSAAEKYSIYFKNIAGVSAGSIAGSFVAAGYNAREISNLMDECNFGDFKISEIANKIPAIKRLYDFSRYSRISPQDTIDRFLQVPTILNFSDSELSDFDNRGFFSNIVQYSKEGCLYDGDALEEWVHKCLKKRGIITFGDLRNGAKDKVNPKGYKMRMTAVDADRKKVIVLPDDLAFYGYDPNKFSVATAVRMSCSVPFAFKPVKLISKDSKIIHTYNIVDGGVLDNFPTWIVENTKRLPTIGFRLIGGQKKLLSLDTPLSIYKSLLMSVHDVGIPNDNVLPDYLGEVDCSSVGFLDMDLDEAQKRILFFNGKASGEKLFTKFRRVYAKKTPSLSIFNFRERIRWVK